MLKAEGSMLKAIRSRRKAKGRSKFKADVGNVQFVDCK
jgi:hypothetical protein